MDVKSMEQKTRFVLKHRTTGQYWGSAEPVRKLWEARRFLNEEQAECFLEVSYYRPDEPELYKIIPVELGIQEVDLSE